MTHAHHGDSRPVQGATSASAAIYEFWGPDIRAIQQIDAVPRILKTACKLTGMRFAAIGRLSPDSWICCAVHDVMNFGMMPGNEIDLASTLCREIVTSGQPIAIDEVAFDANFSDHPAPKMFRFQSNITVPILRRDGTLFGTLCAIDEKPARVDRPEIIESFLLFADLIGSQLDLADALAARPANRPDGG